jgi:AraC-like DNA-binding protein
MSMIDTLGTGVLEGAWPSQALIESNVDREFLAFHRPVCRPLYAFTSGHFPPRAQSLPHSHPCIALHGCLIGPIELILPEGRMILDAGQFVFFPPGQIHSWRSISGATAATIGLLIDADRPGAWPEGSGVTECCEHLRRLVVRTRSFSPVEDVELRTAFWRAADLLIEEKPQSRIAIQSSLWLLLSLGVDRLDDSRVDAVSNEDARRLRRTLLNHVYGDASIAEIAKESRLSLSRAKDVFSSTYGCGIKEYLVQMKIYQAQRLLGDSKLSIQEISHRLGFTSPAYFSRLFRARTAESPQQFRQRLRLGPDQKPSADTLF